MQQMANRMMGKAPAKQQPVSTDGVQVVFQTGHAGGIRAVALSPNGRYIASSGSQDGTVKVWDVASGQEVRTLTGFDMLGTDLLTFSQDSARVITKDMTGGVKVFEVASGREMRSVGSLALSPGSVTVSADGRITVARESRGKPSLAVIDLTTGASLWTLPDSEAQLPVALSPDGKILLTTKTDTSMSVSIGSIFGFGRPSLPTLKQELLIWDLPAKKLRRTWSIKMAEGTGAKISPDGRWLLREDQTTRNLILSDLETGKPVQTIPTGVSGMRGMTNSLTFSPDAKVVAYATSDGTAKLIEVPSGRVQATLQASAVNFSPDGRSLVLAPEGGGAPFLRELASGKETRLAGGGSGIMDLAVMPEGRGLVAAMEGGSAKLWDLSTGQLVRSFECPGGTAARSVAVNDKAAVLATGCMDGSAWLWDVKTGQSLRSLSPPVSAGEFAETIVRFTPDGGRVLVAMRDQLTLWDVTTGKELRRITLPHGPLPKTIALMENPAAAYEGLAPEYKAMMQERVSDQPKMDPKSIERLKEMSHWVRTVALHPDGNLVAVGKQYEVSLWDLNTGQLVRMIGRTSSKPGVPQLGGMPPGMNLGSLQSQGGFPGMPSRGGGLGSLFGSGDAPSAPPAMTMQDPSDYLDMAMEGMGGARSLAFSSDGRLLLSDGVKGKDMWDVATGQKMRPPKAPRQAGFDPTTMLERMELNIGSMGVALSPDGRFGARGHGQVIKIWEVATDQDVLQLVGHTAAVKSLTFSPNGHLLISGGGDGAARIWDLQAGKELASFIALGREDFVVVTPDQFYRASKTRIKGVAFRVKDQLYPFEQFDLRFNRPDVVLTRLGMAPADLVQSYRFAYERRLKKMGLTEQMLGSDFHLPTVEVLTSDVPVSVNTTAFTVRVKATDSKYPLDRFNVFVNDIPIYGTAGVPLPNTGVQSHEQDIQVPLVPGRNKIQVSVLNQQGVESLKQTVYTTSTAEAAPPDVYVVAIGVSEYKNKAYNLRYAAKDANDLLTAYKAIEQRPESKSKVHVLDLTNQKATRPEILKAKDWLKQSKISDLVVVFAAGHGMTDEQSNYYFGTHDIDPNHPATNGLPYEEFENLLDGIPALRKVLLLDTCFSGEIEKDQAVVVAQAETSGSGSVKMRSFKAARGVTIVADTSEPNSGTTNTPRLSTEMVKFQQDWFADLRRGTGAAVISSSSGNEYSLEGEQWKNGVFTYALLNGLKNRGADANKDQTITVSELQTYVIDQVRKLTEGGQNPTVRRENLEYDFAVY
jgi:WD40 repeat protein